MRSVGCAVQQTLTSEAASVLKHSLSLARRRGHAQVTPLHVAATLLSSRTSLLRRACLKSSHPHHQTSHHPLQCRALELCFNVALNRLPTTPGPLLHGQPSLSNALIAALKRAQAHQRRGCIEQQQQQPLLTIKVELEQLIISILNDPSVSRVMREAGFSSINVKANLEDSSATSVFQCYSSSGGVFSSPCSPSPPSHHQNNINSGNFWQTHFLSYPCDQNPLFFSPQKTKISLINNPTIVAGSEPFSICKEDVKFVFEVLVRKKRRNTVIVGDSVSATEGLVSEIMARIERGIQVPEELKSTHFIKFQFSPVSLRFMKREDVEANISELKRRVESALGSSGGGGAIIYTGDLKWTADDDQGCNINGYSPVEHMVAEIARLVSDSNSNSNSKPKVWLMASASYQTYMKCQMRQPPLEIQWSLQAVSVPSGGLGLSLHASSVHDPRIIFSQSPSEVVETKPLIIGKDEEQVHNNKVSCCEECTSNYEKEAQLLKSGQQKLPAWLQPHGIEACRKDEEAELKRKWKRLCYSLHQGRLAAHQGNLYNNQALIGKNYSYASTYPWLSTRTAISPNLDSISFGHDPAPEPPQGSNFMPQFRRQNSCTIEFNFDDVVQKNDQMMESSLDSLKSSEGKEVKITLALGNSVFSDSGKRGSERTLMQRGEMCRLLKENVPWQSESIPSIVEAIIDSSSARQETCWLLIQGNDSIGKRRLGHAIAELVMGSADSLLHFNMNKRGNHGKNPRTEILARALRSNEKFVVLVEDVDMADDTQFLKLLADGFENRKFGEVSRREGINAGQAIFILTRGESTRYEDEANKSHLDSMIQMTLKVEEKTSTSPSFGGVNLDHKRKVDWELNLVKTKTPRIEEKEAVENVNSVSKKGLSMSRQSSFNNNLDLNLKAGEEAGDVSPISSDLTRETTTDVQTPLGFLGFMEKVFVFNRSPARDREIRDLFVSKMERCFEEVYGNGKQNNVVSFSVDKRVLEGVCNGCGYFPNSLFEKWLKDIFQTRLRAVKLKLSGKEGILVRLCLGDDKQEEGILEGFLGSCLPKKIQIS